MKSNSPVLACLVMSAAAFLATETRAQVMPQDNWRYDNLQFSAPDNTRTFGSIAIGSGGVYVEQNTNPVSIAQFQEGGVFIRQFGSFTDVVGIACDSTGNVYVVDSGDRKVKTYDSSGTFLRQWGGSGTGNGLFGTLLNLHDLITVDRADQVYVADPGNQRLQVFDTSGNFLRKWGEAGTLPGQFGPNAPYGVIAAPNGWIYAGGSGYLRVFDAQGNYIKSISTGFGYAMSVSPDGLLADARFNGSPGVYDLEFNGIVGNLGNLPALTGDFNAKGDYYAVASAGNAIRVYEREYSNIQNSLLPPAIPHPTVLASAQRDGTAWLDVDYKVTDADSATVSTAAAAFVNGGNTLASLVPMKTFRENTSSNLGSNIPTGVTKHFTWDMAADWSIDYAQIQVEVLAKDSRNPLGIHWITLPAENGQPAIQVSKAPVSNEQLRSLWFWYLASGHPKVNKANGAGTLYGAGGGYAGLTLATDNNPPTPTNYGLAFVYEQLGIRGISPAEITRAQAGSYGFTSVDSRSVVRDAGITSKVVVGWGEAGSAEVPALVQSVEVTQIASASTSNNAVARLSDGRVLQWTNNTLSTAPNGLTGVAKVAAGNGHFMAIKADGTLWGWGTNGYGQLGVGTTIAVTTPVQVGTATNWTAVACGAFHTIALRTDGTLWSWGRNSEGQLGDSTSTQRTSPGQIGSATDWASPSCGDYSTHVTKTGGTLWAWGQNNYGQLGDSTTTMRTSPVQVGTATDWALVSCSLHTVALKTNGTLWSWGRNDSGQVGDGTTTNRTSPVQIGTASNWTAVACGGSHTAALKTDGTVAAWGLNTSGQTNIPGGLSGVTAIAAGYQFSLALRSNP